jgi:hypothetical protein
MSDKSENVKKSILILDEVAQQMDSIYIARKEEIEKALNDRINLEKEEARKKVEELEKKFSAGKSVLEKHRLDIEELKAEKESARSQHQEHLKQVLHYQGLIEKMANSAVKELSQVRELTEKLRNLHNKILEKLALTKKDIEERFGLKIPDEPPAEPEESPLDLEEERLRLDKIIKLLSTEQAEKADDQALENETSPDAAVEEKSLQETLPETETAGEDANDAEELESVMADLEKLRNADPTDVSGDIVFYRKGKKLVIDGEPLISPMVDTLNKVQALHSLLAQKESPKDQFFIKQDIINQQEILRKIYFETVKLCEKESNSLPHYTSEILNVPSIKDILEKLSLGNWSNHYDFESFKNYATNLINTFYAKITPPLAYLKSMLKQLEEE